MIWEQRGGAAEQAPAQGRGEPIEVAGIEIGGALWIAGEQFIAPLAGEHDGNVLLGVFAEEISGNGRGLADGFVIDPAEARELICEIVEGKIGRASCRERV